MYKKITICLALILIILGTVAVYAAATGKVNQTDGIIIRSAPSTDGDVVTSIGKNTEVEILGKEENWYKIKYAEYEGYIREDLLDVTGEVPTATVPTNTTSATQTTPVENTIVDTNTENSKGSSSIPETPKTNPNAKNTTNADAQVYELPLINSLKKGTIKSGEKIEVLDSVNGWSYVKADKVVGWIRTGKIVDSSKGNDSTPKENTPAPETQKETKTVTTESLNVRSQASTDADVLGTLSSGTGVTVLGEEGNFYKIDYNNGVGYVSKDFVE